MQSAPNPTIRQNLAAFSKAAGSAVVVINSNIDSHCKAEVAHHLAKIGSQERLTVLLESPGGSIEEAYRIAKEIRMWCKHLDVAVTGRAKSAATLVALAADRIFFGPYGELGPLDVQLHDFSGGARPISPLETIRGMEFLRNYYLETFHNVVTFLVPTLDIPHAIEHAPKILAPIATPLYRMIDTPPTRGCYSANLDQRNIRSIRDASLESLEKRPCLDRQGNHQARLGIPEP